MKKVILYIFISALMFGTMEVALKVAGNDLDAFQTTFLRFFLGGLVLLPAALIEIKKSHTKFTARDWFWMFLLGIVCVPASMVLFQLGIMLSNAATAAVLISISPLFTVVFAHFMTDDDRFTKGKVVSLLLGTAGIIMMIRPWNIQPGNTIKGAVLIIVAAALFGLYSVMGGKSVKRIGTFAQTSFSFILGSMVLLVILLIMRRPVIAGVGENLLLIMYLSIFITGLGYLFYFLAIKNSNATTGSIVFFLKPVIAPFIAIIVLKEIITWNMYIGIGLILLASYIIIREKKKNAKKQTDYDILPE